MSQKLVQDSDGNFVWVDARKAKVPGRAVPMPVEGWALGCIESQVEEMRAHAKLSGFTDVEFVPDREVEGWYNCKAPSADRHDKYSEACNIPVKNGQHSGKTITGAELAAAERLINARYPQPKPRRAV